MRVPIGGGRRRGRNKPDSLVDVATRDRHAWWRADVAGRGGTGGGVVPDLPRLRNLHHQAPDCPRCSGA